MAASIVNPHYTCTLINAKGKKYDITNALTDLVLDEPEQGIAQKATIGLRQDKHDGTWTTGLVNVHDRIYIFADTGNGPKEVFRGYVWTDIYQKDDANIVELTAYDNLIYLQESQEYKFYSSGKSTQSIFQDICSDKGIKLSYNHASITHGKLVIKGALSDAFQEDLLEEVRKKTGKRGVIRSTQGNLQVFTEGAGNATAYKFTRGEGGNLISCKHTITMDGIVTKVIILGKEGDNTAAPIKATVNGNTSKYGTIQKILSSSDSDKLADLKTEANQTIKDYGKPQENIELVAVDNPWVRKGDKIHVHDNYYVGYANVKSITHDALKKTMTMEVRRA